MELVFYYNNVEKAGIKYKTLEKAREGFKYYRETLYKFSRFNRVELIDIKGNVLESYSE